MNLLYPMKPHLSIIAAALLALSLLVFAGCLLASAHAQVGRVTDSSKFRAEEYSVYSGTFSRRWHTLKENYYTSLAKIKAAKALKSAPAPAVKAGNATKSPRIKKPAKGSPGK